MILSLIPAGLVDKVWPHILPFAQMIAGGHHGQSSWRDPEHIYEGIASGKELAWCVINPNGQAQALVLGTMIQFPKMRILRIHACVGGERKKWLPLLDEIEEYARANGCGQMQIVCRKGWARELDTYRLTHVLLEKTL